MDEFSLTWLGLLVVILALSSKDLVEVFHNLGGKGGPPTHPLPITSPVETSGAPGKPKE